MDLARLHWAAKRRGILELDILFERYLQDRYPSASSVEQKTFEALLSLQDQTLFDWLVKREPVDQPEFVEMVAMLLG